MKIDIRNYDIRNYGIRTNNIRTNGFRCNDVRTNSIRNITTPPPTEGLAGQCLDPSSSEMMVSPVSCVPLATRLVHFLPATLSVGQYVERGIPQCYTHILPYNRAKYENNMGIFSPSDDVRLGSVVALA